MFFLQKNKLADKNVFAESRPVNDNKKHNVKADRGNKKSQNNENDKI